MTDAPTTPPACKFRVETSEQPDSYGIRKAAIICSVHGEITRFNFDYTTLHVAIEHSKRMVNQHLNSVRTPSAPEPSPLPTHLL